MRSLLAFEWRYHTRQLSYFAAAALICGTAFVLVSTRFGPANLVHQLALRGDVLVRAALAGGDLRGHGAQRQRPAARQRAPHERDHLRHAGRAGGATCSAGSSVSSSPHSPTFVARRPGPHAGCPAASASTRAPRAGASVALRLGAPRAGPAQPRHRHRDRLRHRRRHAQHARHLGRRRAGLRALLRHRDAGGLAAHGGHRATHGRGAGAGRDAGSLRPVRLLRADPLLDPGRAEHAAALALRPLPLEPAALAGRRRRHLRTDGTAFPHARTAARQRVRLPARTRDAATCGPTGARHRAGCPRPAALARHRRRPRASTSDTRCSAGRRSR